MYPADLLSRFNVLTNPEESLRRQVDTIVSSYNSPWDILTELIQNAVDAIHERRRTDSTYTSGRINIEIDPGAGTVSVEDDGAGIPPAKHADMLLPGGSLKKSGNTYGHKGLGFTYCAHVSDMIEVSTAQIGGSPENWSFAGGFSWLSDPTSPPPQLSTGLSNSIRTFTGPGTAVKIRLAVGRYEANRANTAVLDKFFDWAADEKLLTFVIRTRTAIGQTFTLVQRTPPVSIATTVTLVNIAHSFSVPYAFFDFNSHAPLSMTVYSKAEDYANNVYLNPAQHNKTHFGIYHVFDKDPSHTPPLLKVGTHKGGVKFAAYLYACGKDNLNGALVLLR